MSAEHSHDEDEFHVHAHVSPLSLNVGVLMALFVCTFLTLAAYNVRLGDYNFAVAITIASIKAILVGTFFMHLKWERAFNTLFFVGTVIFISVFFGYTYNDTGYRGTGGERDNGARVDYKTGAFANGTPAGIVQAHGELAPVVELHEGGEHAPAAHH